MNRVVIKAALETDYDIYEAESGNTALRLLESNPKIDAVITDIQMPDMDGVELIRTIRKDSKYSHVAIIANTQYGDTEQEVHLLEIGANEFIYKSTTPKLVEMRVKSALRKI